MLVRDQPAFLPSQAHRLTVLPLRLFACSCCLQILLTAGGRFGVVSIVLSLLVRLCLHFWRSKIWCRRQQPTHNSKPTPWWKAAPPWPAVLIAGLPAQLLRLLVRTDTWFEFAQVVTDAGTYIYDAWQAYGYDAVVSVGGFLQTMLHSCWPLLLWAL